MGYQQMVLISIFNYLLSYQASRTMTGTMHSEYHSSGTSKQMYSKEVDNTNEPYFFTVQAKKEYVNATKENNMVKIVVSVDKEGFHKHGNIDINFNTNSPKTVEVQPDPKNPKFSQVKITFEDPNSPASLRIESQLSSRADKVKDIKN